MFIKPTSTKRELGFFKNETPKQLTYDDPVNLNIFEYIGSIDNFLNSFFSLFFWQKMK